MNILFSSGSIVYTGSCFSGIYGIQCHITDKWYVGESAMVPKRIKYYIKNTSKDQISLCRAINKYGIENFSCYKLEECSIDKLYEREVFWGNTLNSITPNGYNLKLGNDKKCLVSDESRQKMSISGKNKIFTDEHKKNISVNQKGMKNRLGKKHSDETKAKMSLSRTGKKKTPMSAEARKNISEARIRKYLILKNNNNKQ